jgi:hypothetical protein
LEALTTGHSAKAWAIWDNPQATLI